MSVINTVLNDLDRRCGDFVPLADALRQPGLSIEPDKPVRHSRFNLFAGLLILLAGLLLVLTRQGWLTPSAPQPQPLTSVATAPTVEPVVVAPERQPEKEPEPHLVGLQVSQSRDALELILPLPDGANSLLKQKTDNLYVFQIVNADIHLLLPKMEQSAWLSDLDFERDGDESRIRFQSKPGVSVETLQRRQDGQSLWVIRLLKPVQKPVQEKQQVRSVQVSGEENPAMSRKVQKDAATTTSTEPEVPYKQQLDDVPLKLKITPRTDESTEVERLQRAGRLVRERQWRAAGELLQPLLGGEQDLPARLLLLETLRVRAQQPALQQLLAQSLRLYPRHGELKLLDAQLRFESADFEQLIQRYRRETDNLPLINLLAASRQRLKQHQAAVQSYRQSLARDPGQSKIWISLAISLEQLGRYQQALEAYRQGQWLGGLNTRLQTFVEARIGQLQAHNQ